ncbi:MAG: response regulator transcription factor [Sedimentitalea sp.]
MTTKVLIIDDDPQIISALVRGLALHGYSAQGENRADRALELLQNEPFAGAIVDVMLGADSGIDLVRAARASGATLPILMLSALSEVEHRAAGLEAGADDYVVKPFNFDELVARLRVQERRAITQRPDPACLLAAQRVLISGAHQIALTEREQDLLTLLIGAGDTPLPRGAIFDALWASDGSSNENVVDVYIGYLRRKLETADFGFEIKTLRNQGFCISGQVPVLDAS